MKIITNKNIYQFLNICLKLKLESFYRFTLIIEEIQSSSLLKNTKY
jgi:hypothetical protein